MIVGPLHGSGISVVHANVAHDFAAQISRRDEHASMYEVTFDLGKPELNLVEPRRIGRREMQLDLRIVFKECVDSCGLVSRQIV